MPGLFCLRNTPPAWLRWRSDFSEQSPALSFPPLIRQYGGFFILSLASAGLFCTLDPMAATDHISEFAVKSQWAFGGMGAFGSGVLTFLSENYYAIGGIGIIGGLAIGIHGAYWLAKIKRIEEQIKLAELEAKRSKLDT